MMQSYQGYFDLLKLRLKGLKLAGRLKKYVLDKILSADFDVSEKVLKKYKPQIIILYREAIPSLDSIAKMYKNHLGGEDPLVRAIEYYLKRVDELIVYVKLSLDNQIPIVAIKSEQIITDSDRVLLFLSKQYGLVNPLSEEYDMNEHTGKVKYGDPSDLIKTGKIIKDRKTKVEIELTKSQEEIIQKKYNELDEAVKKVPGINYQG